MKLKLGKSSRLLQHIMFLVFRTIILHSLQAFLREGPCLFKIVFVFEVIKVNSKFIQKQTTSHFCYILFFQFALINDQPNTSLIMFALKDVPLNIRE